MSGSPSPQVGILAGLLLACTVVHADGERFDIGLRATITAADGEPANDIPGFGVLARYALNERWALGAAIDRSEYDFEEPAKAIGIAQRPDLEPVDALAEATMISLWAERTLADRWFIGAGVGAASVDVPDTAGPRADGGGFDIRTEVDTEIVVSLVGGVRWRFGRRWYTEFALRADQHFADWKITDRVTGAQGSIGDYLAWGGYLAVGLRW